MPKQEMQTTDGGLWWKAVILFIAIYDAVSDIRDGWNHRKAEVEAERAAQAENQQANNQ